jgi:hypothetical protein
VKSVKGERRVQLAVFGPGETSRTGSVRLRDVAEEQLHGLPQRFGFSFAHERLELLIGFELRPVLTQRGEACFAGLP